MNLETIRTMFRGAWQAVNAGGRVVVSDLMLDPSKTRPPFSSLFSLQMLLTTDHGAVFSAAECVTWLHEAGFRDITTTQLPPPLPYTVIVARRSATPALETTGCLES